MTSTAVTPEILTDLDLIPSSLSEIFLEDKKIIASFFKNYDNESTKKEYAYALRDLFLFVGQDISHPSELKRHHIIGYKESLKLKGLSGKTILKKLSAVSKFVSFLGHEGMIDKDITFGLERPKNKIKTQTAALTDEQVEQVFNALDPKRFNYYINRAILAVGFYSGLRVTEIRTLRMKNLGSVGGIRVIQTEIKGGKKHEIALHPKIIRYLDEHISHMRRLEIDVDDPEHVLFPSMKTRRNKPMTSEGISYIFQTALTKAEIELDTDRRYNTHTMRTSFASHLLNSKKIPLQEVQELMGHADPSVTQTYNKRSIDHESSPVFRISY